MEETSQYTRRLQAITEKRKVQVEIDKKRRELEEERLKLQQLKRKSLRDQWLMDPSSPAANESDASSPLGKSQAYIEELQNQLASLQSQITHLENHASESAGLEKVPPQATEAAAEVGATEAAAEKQPVPDKNASFTVNTSLDLQNEKGSGDTGTTMHMKILQENSGLNHGNGQSVNSVHLNADASSEEVEHLNTPILPGQALGIMGLGAGGEREKSTHLATGQHTMMGNHGNHIEEVENGQVPGENKENLLEEHKQHLPDQTTQQIWQDGLETKNNTAAALVSTHTVDPDDKNASVENTRSHELSRPHTNSGYVNLVPKDEMSVTAIQPGTEAVIRAERVLITEDGEEVLVKSLQGYAPRSDSHTMNIGTGHAAGEAVNSLKDGVHEQEFQSTHQENAIGNLHGHGHIPNVQLSIQEEITHLKVSIKEPISSLQASTQEQIPSLQESMQEPINNLQKEIREQIPNLQTSVQKPISDLQTSVQEHIQNLHASVQEPIASIQSSLQGHVPSLLVSDQGQMPSLKSSSQTPFSNLQASIQKQTSNLQASFEEPISNIQASFHGKIPDLHLPVQEQIQNQHASVQGQIPNLQGSIQESISDLQASIQQPISNLQVFTQEQIPKLQDAIQEPINNLQETITGKIPILEASIKKPISDLQTSIQEQIPGLQASIEEPISSLQESLQGQIPVLQASVQGQMPRVEASTHQPFSNLQTSIQKQTSNLQASFEEPISNLQASIQGETSSLQASIQGQIPSLRESIQEHISDLQNSVHEQISNLHSFTQEPISNLQASTEVQIPSFQASIQEPISSLQGSIQGQTSILKEANLTQKETDESGHTFITTQSTLDRMNPEHVPLLQEINLSEPKSQTPQNNLQLNSKLNAELTKPLINKSQEDPTYTATSSNRAQTNPQNRAVNGADGVGADRPKQKTCQCCSVM